MLRLRLQALSLFKAGSHPEEYEDAWAINELEQMVAIADGATDAFESRLWAQALVEAFVKKPPVPRKGSLVRWLEQPIRMWRDKIQWDQLPWYSEEKARRGAFATLLGLRLVRPAIGGGNRADGPVRWAALALGDTCLFHIRGEKVIALFPVHQSDDFGTTPSLLATRLDYNRHSLDDLQYCTGELLAGDLLVLATDALAAWFLRLYEAGMRPWEMLTYLTPDSFVEFVARLRRENAIRNDDVTLVLGWTDDSNSENVHPMPGPVRMIEP